MLGGITLTAQRGEFVCILGPSGCGKSTLLDILAGFERATRGGVYYDDREITGPGTDRAVIFQDVSNALFPWLSAAENVEYGSRMRALPRAERRSRAMEYLRLVGLNRDARKFPYELSGGMKQRVQIARALANDADVLLMDEPFAALDAINKTLLQEELLRIWRGTAKTIVFVTHDIAESVRLGTQIAVMSRGPDAKLLNTFAIPREDPDAMRADDHAELKATIEQLIRHEVEEARRGYEE